MLSVLDGGGVKNTLTLSLTGILYNKTPPFRSNAEGSECADVKLVDGGLVS